MVFLEIYMLLFFIKRFNNLVYMLIIFLKTFIYIYIYILFIKLI